MSANLLFDLIQKVAADFNHGELDAWSNNYAAGYEHHNPYQPEVNNLQTYKQFEKGFQGAFPGLEMILDDVVTQGTPDSGSVAIRSHVQGTGKGTWRGADVTGKTVNLTCVLFIKIVDGKLVEGWEIDDYLAFFKQLGLIPAPASTAAPA